jgi:hypothetical protein
MAVSGMGSFVSRLDLQLSIGRIFKFIGGG